MSRLTRDGTAEPVSRDQILRHARGQGDMIFSVQLTTSRIGNLTRLSHTLLPGICDDHTYKHTYTAAISPLQVSWCTAAAAVAGLDYTWLTHVDAQALLHTLAIYCSVFVPVFTPQKEGGGILCDPGWCVHKSDVQNKWDDSTHLRWRRFVSNQVIEKVRGRNDDLTGFLPKVGHSVRTLRARPD